MAESPTSAQVKAERADIDDYVEDNPANLSLDDYIARALAQVKRDVEDVKGYKWSTIYNSTTSDYFLNTDGEAHNKDRMHNLIIQLTIAYVFKDYSTARGDEARWASVYLAYRGDYDLGLDQVKLDVDWDESGEISEDEEGRTTQVFVGR